MTDILYCVRSSNHVRYVRLDVAQPQHYVTFIIYTMLFWRIRDHLREVTVVYEEYIVIFQGTSNCLKDHLCSRLMIYVVVLRDAII